LNPDPLNKSTAQQLTPELQRNDTEAKSESIVDILIKVDQDKQKARVNLMHQFKQASNLPKFQSTHIEKTASLIDNDNSIFFTTLEVSNPYTISSTMIAEPARKLYATTNLNQTPSKIDFDKEDSEINAFSNQTYYSPNPQRFVDLSTNSQTNESESSVHHSANSKLAQSDFFKHDSNQLYVCIIPYKAKFQGDISLYYAERVNIIHVNNGLSLVQNISTKLCGYIPNNCIMPMRSFLNQL
jgi:hypothetical protein